MNPMVECVSSLRANARAFLSADCVLALGAFLYGYKQTNLAMKTVLARIEPSFPGLSEADICTRAYLHHAETEEALQEVLARLSDTLSIDEPPAQLGWDGAYGFIEAVQFAVARKQPGMALAEPTVVWLRDCISGCIEGMRAVEPARADEQAARLVAFDAWLREHIYDGAAPWYAQIRVAEGLGVEGIYAFVKWWDRFEAEQRDHQAGEPR